MPVRLLVVDDELDFRRLLADSLSENPDYTVEDCESGEEALRLLERSAYDVIILDYRMPGMSGLNVLQWMHEQKMQTPVIMLTAAGSETVAVEAMKLGAYDYVRKEQVDIEHLQIIINGVHERNLFRKERDQAKLERAKDVVALQTFHSTIESIALMTQNAMGILTTYIRESQEELLPYMKEEGRGRFVKMLDDLRNEFSVISTSVQSMLNWSSTTYERLTRMREPKKPDAAPAKNTQPVDKEIKK